MHQAGLPAEPPDWYAALSLPTTATGDQISAAVERMSRQATALSVTAPERSRLLRDQIRAIKQDLLSGDAQRQRYDQQRAQAQAARGGGRPAAWLAQGVQRQAQAGTGQAGMGQAGAGQAQFGGLMSRVAKFLQTGWTCATCGYGALPNDKFCHKCGSPIEAPAIAQQRPGGPGPAQQAAPAAGQGAPAALGQQQPLPTSQPQQAGQAGQVGQAGQAQPGFCGKCGGLIAPANVFCTQCGAARA